jgi:hypothetical protein
VQAMGRRHRICLRASARGIGRHRALESAPSLGSAARGRRSGAVRRVQMHVEGRFLCNRNG